ncbi:MAG: TM2 domain-containing protein [Bacteroidales bacterium]|nr:TM2 domain-containing protein [Bacteroidales bacterium]
MMKKIITLIIFAFIININAYSVESYVINKVNSNIELSQAGVTQSSVQPATVNKIKKQRFVKIKKRIKDIKEGNDKSWVAALLLCFFLGALGIHRFYLGYPVIGVIQLLTLGFFGIWTLIDFILIIVKGLKPKNGEYTD